MEISLGALLSFYLWRFLMHISTEAGAVFNVFYNRLIFYLPSISCEDLIADCKNHLASLRTLEPE